jgi:hypothetical protein
VAFLVFIEVKPRDPEWAIGDLTAALIIGVEEVLVVLG